jgi:hypothetical protein
MEDKEMNINSEVFKEYGEARFAAGFYFAISFLDEDQEKNLIEKYKEFIEGIK